MTPSRRLMVSLWEFPSATTDALYRVIAQPCPNIFSMLCTCPAGRHGRVCKHTKAVAEELVSTGEAVATADGLRKVETVSA
jgi:uncharacterized Zn finger protein